MVFWDCANSTCHEPEAKKRPDNGFGHPGCRNGSDRHRRAPNRVVLPTGRRGILNAGVLSDTSGAAKTSCSRFSGYLSGVRATLSRVLRPQAISAAFSKVRKSSSEFPLARSGAAATMLPARSQASLQSAGYAIGNSPVLAARRNRRWKMVCSVLIDSVAETPMLPYWGMPL